MTAASQTPPTRPSAFGEELRRLRESAGLTLEEIMAETKISRRILEALESGRFQHLPERVFSRNFVRQYAVLIGFEQERLLEWFDEAWKRFELASGSFQAVEIEPEMPTPPIRWRFWIPIGLAGLIVAVVVVAIVRSAPVPPELEPDPRRARVVPTEQNAAPTVIPESTSPDEAGNPSAPSVNDMIDLTVTVGESRECWLHFRDRDGRTGERLLTGGDSVTLELAGPAVVTLGNAGAIASIEAAGGTYESLGSPGEVLHLEVSTEGVRQLKGAAPVYEVERDTSDGRRAG
ncbi:MAG: DUF4115 domain-containing protein [bacterium]|nr:DUF4115 domain-containing protein [bacterium]